MPKTTQSLRHKAVLVQQQDYSTKSNHFSLTHWIISVYINIQICVYLNTHLKTFDELKHIFQLCGNKRVGISKSAQDSNTCFVNWEM